MSGIVSRIRQHRSRRRLSRRTQTSAGYGPLAVAGLILWSGASILLLGLSPIFHEVPVVGLRASVTIVAATEFQCVDLDRSRIVRQMAADAVPPVFTVNRGPLGAHLRAVEKWIRRVEMHREDGADLESARSDLLETFDLLGLNLTPDDAYALVPAPASASKALHAFTSALNSVWSEGIVSDEDREKSIPKLARTGQLLIEPAGGGAGRLVDVGSLRTPTEAVSRFAELVVAGHRSVEPGAAADRLLQRTAQIPEAIRRATGHGDVAVAVGLSLAARSGAEQQHQTQAELRGHCGQPLAVDRDLAFVRHAGSRSGPHALDDESWLVSSHPNRW